MSSCTFLKGAFRLFDIMSYIIKKRFCQLCIYCKQRKEGFKVNLNSEDKLLIEQIWKKLESKMQICVPRNKGKLPRQAKDGVYDDMLMVPNGDICWTNGFWGAMNRLMYYVSKNEIYQEAVLQLLNAFCFHRCTE